MYERVSLGLNVHRYAVHVVELLNYHTNLNIYKIYKIYTLKH